ncbi:hypothetical protein [Larsenimonas suaedae]|uniref:Calcium-binding protein n=1 Tax=Larsenimonas suaedae TaxID=1851019 RepID=A0ABU1GW04_9GAMM|nr:hypothetical protein [Larsenimonas suaedae]MCM2971946.1 hypothetical protein [Larsenimonas suaedae]MDR5895498.1 hypothetical protein [Larsenimonas suaedae]
MLQLDKTTQGTDTMPYTSKTQSYTFTEGGDVTFTLPDDVTSLALAAQFADDRAKSGETLDANVNGEALESLELTGNGRIDWDNSADDTAAVTHVDATGLSGGLEYTASNDVQETVMLGGDDNGVDVIRVAGDASRYGNGGDAIDTISGFDAAKDTLFVDDEIVQSFDNLDFDYAVVAEEGQSAEEALMLAGEQDSGDALMPVMQGDDIYLYRDTGPAGLDENDFTLLLEDVSGGVNSLSDRQYYISERPPAPTGPYDEVVVDGRVSGTDDSADSFVFESDGAWQGGTITNFELGVDRIDVTGINGSDGQPLDYDDISAQPGEIMLNTDQGIQFVELVGVPKYDDGLAIGDFGYAMGPEEFLFA